jgi:hypothetical protein
MEDGFRYIVDSWDAVYKIDVRPLCARPNHAARVARLIAERLIGVACIRGYPKARSTMIELAWLWLRHQPDSPLSIWFRERRKGEGSGRGAARASRRAGHAPKLNHRRIASPKSRQWK